MPIMTQPKGIVNVKTNAHPGMIYQPEACAAIPLHRLYRLVQEPSHE
jgi:hypothetical protein